METRDITVKRGDTWDGLEYRITINGAVLPVGTSAKIDIRRDGETGPLLQRLSTADGTMTITNESTYTAIRIIPILIEIISGSHYYDLEINMNGRIKTYIGGLFIIEQDVTNG